MNKQLLFILWIGLIFVSCSKQVLTLPEIPMNSINDFDTFSTNQAIRLVFRGLNNESGFIGYNIYVGTQEGVVPAHSVSLGYMSVSYPLASSSPGVQHVLVLTNDSFQNRIQNRKKYFVSMAAVNYQSGNYRIGPMSPVSKVVPLTNFVFDLYDQALTNQTNDGLMFSMVDGTPSRINVPDIPIAGAVGLYFTVRANPDVPQPFLSVFSNNIQIQDIGYYQGMNSRNYVPYKNEGYSSVNDSILLVQNHIIAFYDSTRDMYGKIWVENIPSNLALASSESKIRLHVIVHYVAGDNKF